LAVLALAIFALTATSASATPPTATMDTVSAVSITSAHVTGTVNPGDQLTYYAFEFSTDEQNWIRGPHAFGDGTPVTENSGPTKVEENLTGLSAGTEYFLRINTYVINEGVERPSPAPYLTFTTDDPATVPSLALEPATNVKYTTAHLAGTIDPEGGNVDSLQGPLAIYWQLQYTRDPINEGWQLAEAGEISNQEPEGGGPIPAASNSPIAVAKDVQGLRSGSEYKFRLVASYAGREAISPEGSFETEAATAPTVSIVDATAITAHGAHFSGQVNPNGADPAFYASCEFDYVTDAQFQAGGFENLAAGHAGCGPENPVTANAPTAVEADPTNLDPGAVYHLRLRAENQAGVNTAVATNSFETEPVAPLIGTIFANDVTATAATLRAQINPGGDPTTYHFEYLTQAAYEATGEAFTGATKTPESASIGADYKSHLAEAAIAGLQPDSAYVFRVVATNSKSDAGGTLSPVRSFHTASSAPDACPNAEVRAQQQVGYLPDCRAYEQVSPVNKHGNEAGAGPVNATYTITTADGNRVLYGGSGAIGEANRGLQSYSVANRLPDGTWSTRAALPAGSPFRIDFLQRAITGMLSSSDLSEFVFTAKGSFVPENPDTQTASAIYRANSDGSIDWLSQPLIPNPTPAPGEIPFASVFEPVGASPDLSTVYFWAAPTLLPEDAARVGSGGWGLYEYTGGELKPAGTLPDGTQSPGGAAPAASASGGLRSSVNLNTPETFGNEVSRDGSTLFFVSPETGGVPQLYVRRGGHSTLVSHSPGGAEAPDGVAGGRALNQNRRETSQVAYGSADGSTAIFRSQDALTPDAPNDSSVKSYRYDVATDTVSYMPGVADATVTAATEDDQRFLFANGNRIAVWDHGTIKTIASVSGPIVNGVVLSPARATASGSVFLFTTNVAIPGFHTGGEIQLYRYNVIREKISCPSCPPDDVVPSGPATLSNVDTASNGELPSGLVVPNRGLNEDASRVFFDSPDPLLPQDTNGTSDVYEWTPNRLSLISSGHDKHPSYFLDNSADGDHVFFATRENLGADDGDGSFDVYDAHVDGGILRREVTPCAGEECLNGASPKPPPATPTTDSFSGPGNPKLCPKGKVSKGGSCVKQKTQRKHHKKKSHKRAGNNRGGGK
jgi:hypothetical protein